jgi:hypothetical protein
MGILESGKMIQRPAHNEEDVSTLRRWREAITTQINRLIFSAPVKLTIASGVITVTQASHTVETEGGGATDDLDTINGGADGKMLILRAFDTTHTVVVKNGTGNIRCGSDMSLDSREDTMTLMYIGDLMVWVEIARANNA